MKVMFIQTAMIKDTTYRFGYVTDLLTSIAKDLIKNKIVVEVKEKKKKQEK